MTQPAHAVLFVDDEPQACKWFARTFSDEFTIFTAGDADAALALLQERGEEVAVLITDQRMPGRSGLELLAAVQREGRHLVRLLMTAFAEKEVAIAAINQGRVLRLLEKPIDEGQTRAALREALALYRAQAQERALAQGRAAAMRATLGFLAHELRTPLATVSGCVEAVAARHQPPPPGAPAGLVQFAEDQPGEVLAALERAARRVQYCQSLVTTFLQSARDAQPVPPDRPLRAAALVQAMLDGFPFDGAERSWVACRVTADFDLPDQRDLVYLVLSTLTKNAVLALRDQPQPQLHIEVEEGCIRFVDNGPGIAPEVLQRLTHEPVTTRAASGGSGMGLLFCRRVLQSMGGAIEISSEPGHGTTILLTFTTPRALGRAGAITGAQALGATR